MKINNRIPALGIDFGGTAIKMGLVDQRGNLLETIQAPTAGNGTPEKFLDLVETGLTRLAPRRRVAGIGVGVPGFVNFDQGFIYNLTNVRGWKEVPLAAMLQKRFGLPACVENDVNAMALGECAFGAGRGRRHAVFATLGTGVGGAVVINGELYRGAYSMAGEIGHIPIVMHGRCAPEGRGGLELYVGNRRIAQYARAGLRRAGRGTLLGRLAGHDPRRITPRIIAAAARRNDPLALRIFDRVADCLATAFAGVTYLLQPEVIIVGGGVAQSGRILFAPLRRHLRERLHPQFARRIKVIPARLGAAAGMIGCAVLVFQARADIAMLRKKRFSN